MSKDLVSGTVTKVYLLSCELQTFHRLHSETNWRLICSTPCYWFSICLVPPFLSCVATCDELMILLYINITNNNNNNNNNNSSNYTLNDVNIFVWLWSGLSHSDTCFLWFWSSSSSSWLHARKNTRQRVAAVYMVYTALFSSICGRNFVVKDVNYCQHDHTDILVWC